MRHGKSYRKLGRPSSHRKDMLRNLATSLVLEGSIETTLPRAKELKRVADKLVTLGKRNTLHSRRQALSYLRTISSSKDGFKEKRSAVHVLFEDLALRFKDRPGGYTRVLKTGKRPGDMADMAVICFVEEEVAKKAAPKKRRSVKRDALAKAEPEVKEEATAEETETK